MPIFQYEAIDAKSEVTTGNIEAANKADATQQLRSNGLFPKQIIEVILQFLHKPLADVHLSN